MDYFPVNDDDNKSFKRKKKRSFMQQVKKKFKKGPLLSEGSNSVNTTDFEYFLRVLEVERSFVGSVEEKRIFANNALTQTEGLEVKYSFNQLISRVIEKLLPLASNTILNKYFEAFGANLRPICVHEFASHVLQALMVIAAKRSLDCTEPAEPDDQEDCKSWLLKVCKFLLNNVEEFMWDTYANPALRTAALCLAGAPQLDKHYKAETENSSDIQLNKVPEEYEDLLEEYFKRVSSWPQFKDFVDNPLSSGYLQTLLLALSQTNKKMHKKLCKKILNDCFLCDISNSSFSHSALFVLDSIIDQSSKKMQIKVYTDLVKDRLLVMATAKVGNTTLQKLLNKCNSPSMLTEIVSVLAPKFEDILDAKNTLVLVSVCEACERLNTAQSEFLQGLMKCLKCDNLEENPQLLVPSILSLSPLSDQKKSTPVTKLGSLLLQHLLKFQKPTKFVNSLLSYEPKHLADLFTSIFGSFISKAFCESETVGEKNRLKLIQKLAGHYAFLAQSKCGSRTFDDIWKVADIKSKEQIVKELASSYSETMQSQYGKFIASKVFLDLYRNQDAPNWRTKIQSIQSKKNLFANIIRDVE